MFFLLITLTLPLLITLVSAAPERLSLLPRSSGCLAGYKAYANGTCFRVVPNYNCDPSKCYGTIPANSYHTCSPDGDCDFSCSYGYLYNGTTCNKQKVCDPATCDAHTPKNAKTTCFDDKCYFICNPGYHRIADFCKRTIYACTKASQCPVLRPDFSTTFCNSGLCAVTCDNGYQFSENKNHCVPNLTKCGTTSCSTIANGEVKCNGDTCVYSCNAAAGYKQTGPTTCTHT